MWTVWVCQVSVGDPDPQDPHVFGLPDPDPLVRGMDPDPANTENDVPVGKL
jgi:hypothetical protein